MSEVEACLCMLDAMEIVTMAELKVWRKVLTAFPGLEYEKFAVSLLYLSLVRDEKRRDCFIRFGFSPKASEFSRWAMREGLNFKLAAHHSWILNSVYDFAYGPGEFLVLAGGKDGPYTCAEVWRYVRSELTLGPADMAGLPYVVAPEAVIGGSRFVFAPVRESVQSIPVTAEERVDLGKEADVVEVPNESPVVTTYAMVFEPGTRSELVEYLGDEPTLGEVVSAPYPMLADLSRVQVTVQGSSFDIGQTFEGQVDSYGFSGVLTRMCAHDPGIWRIRRKHDALSRGADEDSSGVLGNVVFFLEDWKGLKYQKNLRISSRVAEYGKYGYLPLLTEEVKTRVATECGPAPTLSEFLLAAGGNLVSWQADWDADPDGVESDYVFVRFRGEGSQRQLDSAWVGSKQVTAGKRVVFPWLRRVKFGTGCVGPGLGVVVACDELGNDEVPFQVVAEMEPGWTYVRLKIPWPVGQAFVGGHALTDFAGKVAGLVGGLPDVQVDRIADQLSMLVDEYAHGVV